MNDAALFLVHEGLCLALFYAVFCRARLTSAETTRRDVRLVLTMEGAIACFGLALPMVSEYQPSLYSLCLLAALTLPKLVFARGWINGVPQACLKESHDGKVH